MKYTKAQVFNLDLPRKIKLIRDPKNELCEACKFCIYSVDECVKYNLCGDNKFNIKLEVDE